MTRRRTASPRALAALSAAHLAAASACLVCDAGLARADEPQDAAESRATSFQAVEGPTAEQVPGGTLLVAAYAVVLVLLVVYVGRLGALQRRNQSELERLSAAVERARKA